MFNPWDNGSKAYRITLLTGTGLILLGIVLALIGGGVQVQPIQWAAIGLIGFGLVTHLVAQVLRARDAQRRHRQARQAGR
ncbi:hypothetical protein GCM10010977_19610 [Citricoccus zhacaiensis]|uniref:DUF3188 domain-containing protein n=1 Tax=Citricoccus zhacaiensis TaxID=489142 RepID=A0ABQ2M1Y5_9MICC|nr:MULTISPECIES: hypothetical protein [Citricoccus]GGO45896.1 hypothetical protein GCM10010977_19610 [Citricoccus zhacaiensis]VXB74225.1 conserved hypothetical protein [Citricoccus sp. K5]